MRGEEHTCVKGMIKRHHARLFVGLAFHTQVGGREEGRHTMCGMQRIGVRPVVYYLHHPCFPLLSSALPSPCKQVSQVKQRTHPLSTLPTTRILACCLMEG